MIDNKSLTLTRCPHAEFEGWDLMVSTEGDYICKNNLNPDEPGEYGGPGDRPICKYSGNYFSCPFYQKATIKK